MRVKVCQATHPDMMPVARQRDAARPLPGRGPFAPDEISLTYSHDERFVIGGAMPVSGRARARCDQGDRLGSVPGAPRDGRHQRRRRRAASPSTASVYELAPRDGLYVADGQRGRDVRVARRGEPAKFYLASTPAHRRFETVKISARQAMPMERGSLETSNERTIYQYVHPRDLQVGAAAAGPDDARSRAASGTRCRCHLHDRRSEIYFYFDLSASDRVFHFMGEPDETRHIVVGQRAGGDLAAVVDPHGRRAPRTTRSSGRWAARTWTTPTWTSSTMGELQLKAGHGLELHSIFRARVAARHRRQHRPRPGDRRGAGAGRARTSSPSAAPPPEETGRAVAALGRRFHADPRRSSPSTPWRREVVDETRRAAGPPRHPGEQRRHHPSRRRARLHARPTGTR